MTGKMMLEHGTKLEGFMINRRNNKETERSGVRRVDRTIYFFSDVDSDSVSDAIFHLQHLEGDKSSKPIQVVICSDGGNCYDGLALYDKLRSSDHQIVTVATGLVASMGTCIFLAGDERYATENARFMVHQVSTGGEYPLRDAEIDLKETRALEEIMLDINAERTDKTLKSLKVDRKNGDNYFGAEKALEDGYIEKIIKNKKTPRRRKKKS